MNLDKQIPDNFPRDNTCAFVIALHALRHGTFYIERKVHTIFLF